MAYFFLLSPLPTEQIFTLIKQAWNKDVSMMMVTQELLIYLGLFVSTEPQLFEGMIRLRLGLIIQVMIGELERTLNCSSKLILYEVENVYKNFKYILMNFSWRSNGSLFEFKSFRDENTPSHDYKWQRVRRDSKYFKKIICNKCFTIAKIFFFFLKNLSLFDSANISRRKQKRCRTKILKRRTKSK